MYIPKVQRIIKNLLSSRCGSVGLDPVIVFVRVWVRSLAWLHMVVTEMIPQLYHYILFFIEGGFISFQDYGSCDITCCCYTSPFCLDGDKDFIMC